MSRTPSTVYHAYTFSGEDFNFAHVQSHCLCWTSELSTYMECLGLRVFHSRKGLTSEFLIQQCRDAATPVNMPLTDATVFIINVSLDAGFLHWP